MTRKRNQEKQLSLGGQGGWKVNIINMARREIDSRKEVLQSQLSRSQPWTVHQIQQGLLIRPRHIINYL